MDFGQKSSLYHFERVQLKNLHLQLTGFDENQEFNIPGGQNCGFCFQKKNCLTEKLGFWSKSDLEKWSNILKKDSLNLSHCILWLAQYSNFPLN